MNHVFFSAAGDGCDLGERRGPNAGRAVLELRRQPATATATAVATASARPMATARRTAVALLPLLAALAGCASPGSGPQPIPVSAAAQAPAPATGSPVRVWLTTGDRRHLLAEQRPLSFDGLPQATPVAAASRAPAAPAPATAPPAPPPTVNIAIDDSLRYQTMVGFGASLTDASAWLIRHRMSPSQRQALLRELFSRDGDGVGFDLTRLTIGASDFSREHYSLDDRPPGQADPALEHFSIAPNQDALIPVVKEAIALNPRLKIMASPWSAPAWMKTSASLIKGSLKPEHYDSFARYLLRYVEAYAAQGIPIFALTLQNEPHFEPDDYPGMRLDPAARAALFGRHAGPLFERQGRPMQWIEWDHNWDDTQAPLAVLADPQARRYVSGVGWHCYAGEVKAQEVVQAAHPDKDVWFTECSGGEWKPHWPETLPWMMRNLVIGSTRAWARGVLMWNLALDENHGPHRGGCKDCRGMVTIDSRTGAVTRNMEYYAFAHASKFVRQGAQRIASTSHPGEVDTVAFRHPDDGSLVLVACNSAPQTRRVVVQHAGRRVSFDMPRESVATWVWQPVSGGQGTR